MRRRFKSLKWLALVMVIVAFVTVGTVLAKTIVVDGSNISNEWDGVTPAVDDEDDEDTINDNTVDVRDVYLTSDISNLYFRIDTWSMPPSHDTNRIVRIYIDIDRNSATGCEDVVNHDFGGTDGYERHIIHYYSGFPNYQWYTIVEQCVNGSWSFLTTASYGHASILEFGAALADLGISSGSSLDFFVYYDGGTSDPDDEVPGTGEATYEFPTAVTLAAFEATPQDEAILVTWETAMELDNVGFNLYRSATEEGPYAQLNETLIPPQFPGEVMGGYYEWLDTDVQPGVIYYYKLEDIDVKGVSAFHGPVSTSVVAAPTAVAIQSVFASGVAMPVILGLTLLLGAVIATRRRR
jgi:hypothetical protein